MGNGTTVSWQSGSEAYGSAGRSQCALHVVITVALRGVCGWFESARVPLLFAMMFTFEYWMLDPIRTFAYEIGYAVNPLILPFVLSGATNQLIIALGMVFLLADAPFMREDQLLVICRTGRRAWVMGQLVYTVLATAIYLAVIALLSIVILAPVATFNTNGWGVVVSTLAYTDASSALAIDFSFSEKIITQFSPVQAFVLQLGIEYGALLLVGLIVFALSLYIRRAAGMFAGLLVSFLDLLIVNILPYQTYALSPLSMARLSVLDYSSGTSLYNPTVEWAIFVISLTIAAVICLCIALAGRISVEVIPEI